MKVWLLSLILSFNFLAFPDNCNKDVNSLKKLSDFSKEVDKQLQKTKKDLSTSVLGFKLL